VTCALTRDPKSSTGMRMALTPFLSCWGHVLLIAAPVGQTDDLLRAIIGAVGNKEKVMDLIEEGLLALLHTDVLAHHDQPIETRAFAGLISISAMLSPTNTLF
jgi:hypothetical protein